MRRLVAGSMLVVLLLAGCSADAEPATEKTRPTPGTPRTSSATPASNGPVRYVALGDSVTSGEGVLPDEAYPSLLADLWRETGCEVELSNVAVTGYRSEDVLLEELPAAVAFEPTVVTLMVGGNDIANGVGIEDYRANVRQILAGVDATGAQIITVSMQYWDRTPVGQGYGAPEDLAEQRTAFDEVLVEEGEAVGAAYVDLTALFEEQAQQAMWLEDELHPTPEAYVGWADGIFAGAPSPCAAG